MAHITVPVSLVPAVVAVRSNAYTGPYGHAFFPPALLHHGDYLTGLRGKGVGSITGTVQVKLPPEVPLRARVRLMRETDGRVMRETWSDGATGSYAFFNLDELQTYTALAYHPGGDYRAEAADRLVPTVPAKKGMLT